VVDPALRLQPQFARHGDITTRRLSTPVNPKPQSLTPFGCALPQTPKPDPVDPVQRRAIARRNGSLWFMVIVRNDWRRCGCFKFVKSQAMAPLA
jgi:hypothetical protein